MKNFLKNNFLFLIFSVAVCIPWLLNYLYVTPNLFMETQYELNIQNLVTIFKFLEPSFSYGMESYNAYSIIFYLLPVHVLGFLFGKAAWVLYIGVIIYICFLFTYKIFYRYFLNNALAEKQKKNLALCIAFLYTTSPTIFLYFKSTIALTLPALIFPLQLFLIFEIIAEKQKAKNIFFLFVSFIVISFCNITTIFLNIGFLVLFTWFFFQKRYFYTLLVTIFSSLSVVIFIACIVYLWIKLTYMPHGGVLENIREDFYSNQTSILQIAKQTTDWAFFGGFEGKPYFEFSKFYRENFIQIIGLIFGFWAVIFAVFFWRKNTKTLLFVMLFLLIFVFMLGNKFFLYDYLYKNFTPFQLFRNITKFAPFLLFSLCIIFAWAITNQNRALAYILIGFGLIYNIPYFTYHQFFVQERIVSELPWYWQETVDFVNKNLPENSNIIAFPSVYINEVYDFDSGEVLVGSMLDRFSHAHSYRLSPILVWDYFIQNEMEKIFISSNNSRWKEVDIQKINHFIIQFNFEYILITKTVKNAYESADKYINLFSGNSNFEKIFENNENIIFYNKTFISNPDIFSRKMTFTQKKFWNYLWVATIQEWEKIILNKHMHSGWKIYLEPFSEISCANPKMYSGEIFENWRNTEKKYIIESRDTLEKIVEKLENISLERIQKLNPGITDEKLQVGQEIIISENSEQYQVKECQNDKQIDFWEGIEKILQTSICDNTHQMEQNYANSWKIDKEYIRKNFSKEYYHENEDGSIDIKFSIYFKPQSYFYLWLILSFGAFLALIIFIAIAWKRKR